MIGGFSVSLSGIALMFPFQTAMFAKTFGLLNVIGFDLPTALTALQEQQLEPAMAWYCLSCSDDNNPSPYLYRFCWYGRCT